MNAPERINVPMGRPVEKRSIATITIAAVVGLNVLVFGGLALAGVPLLPGSADGSDSATDDLRYVPLADTQTVPAYTAVRAVLAGPLDGVKAAGPTWASSGTPFDKACPDTKDPAPVVSYARPYRAGGGVVSVRIAAYGAGQGAAAVEALVDRLESCDGAGATGTATGPNSTAVAAFAQTSSSNASVLLWNRSDVVASVTVPRTSPVGLAAVAKSVDKALAEQLEGTCASEDVSVADAGRSPWSGVPFTGNLEPRPVELSYPDPTLSPTPVVPSDVPIVPVPAPTLLTPRLATIPPESPVLASDAPTPPVITPSPAVSGGAPGPAVVLTSSPAVPAAPSAPPTSIDVDEQVDDQTGPGCGWAFTAQGIPPFDAPAAQAKFAADIESTRAQLFEADARWQTERGAYAVAYAQYVREVDAFATYAREFNAYAADAENQTYAQLLEEYQTAVAFRELFESDRAAASEAYNEALQACALAGSPTTTPEPTVTPEATVEPVPTDIATEPATTCPPEVPSILTEQPPEVPPSPKPNR